jgi:CelD/BcsL family acetyltransferase involved in cellulose biosynthesis
MITIEKVTTREQMQRLEKEWNSLLACSSSNSITLTHQWLSTWWDVFSDSRELFILLVRDERELIGIAPLLRRTVQHYGLLEYRRLEFLASGEDEADEICSEYLDFILRRGREREALEAIMRQIGEEEREWDEMLLTDVRGESESLAHLSSLCGLIGIKEHLVRNQTSIYVPLTDSWETFVKALGAGFRKKIERDRKAMAASGRELRIIESEEGFDEQFDILVKLHQARWTARGEPGVFASQKFTRFHRLLAPKLLSKGWLKLFVLMLGGEPVAALYAFTYNNSMQHYQGGFITCGNLIASPGMLVQSYAMEKAIEMGLSEYDFLKGDVGSYKSKWGSRVRTVVQMRLAQPRSKEALYSTTTRLIEGLRSIKRALQACLLMCGPISGLLQ